MKRFFFIFFMLCYVSSICGQQNTEAQKGVDYIAIVPQQFESELAPLIALREKQGYICRVVTTEQIFKTFGKGRFSNYAIKHFLKREFTQNKSLKYVLLAADAHRDQQANFPSIPTWMVETYFDKTTASDHPYTCMNSEKPAFALGRLPGRTKSQIKSIVDKIIAYEQAPVALWQRKIDFIAGEGNFGAAADAFCEFIFQKLVESYLPAYYKITMTYGNPRSPYYYPAQQFPEVVAAKMSEDSLFFVYVGHGSWDSLGEISYKKRLLPIFNKKHISLLKTQKSRPFMVSIACSTSFFDHATATSLGEELVLHPQGPIAFIGSSRISHPYANALLGKSFLEGIAQNTKTIGDLYIFTQKKFLEEPKGFDFLRFTIDNGAKLFAGADNHDLQKLRRDHAYLYGILGDPATTIRTVKNDININVTETTENDTTTLSVTCHFPKNIPENSYFELTLEASRGQFPGKLLSTESNTNIIKNHSIANDPVLKKNHGQTSSTPQNFVWSIPNISPGKYYIKVIAVPERELHSGSEILIVRKKEK